jgi:hypothetical protein
MKDIFFIGYDAIGDYISNNGMIRFLLQKYKRVFVVTDLCDSFIQLLFHDNKNIISLGFNEYYNKCLTEESFDIIDTRVGELYYHDGSYFNKLRKIGISLNIDIGDEEITDNASQFYVHMGLPRSMRINNFYFERMIEDENDLFERLKLNSDYSVVCDYDPFNINRKYINTNFVINLHKLSSNFVDTIKVIENAKEVHLIENSVALFVYHLQSKDLMKNVEVNLHAYARTEWHRKCDGPDCNNPYLNMLLKPKLDNWNVIWYEN